MYQAQEASKANRNELIRSYGFIEQVSTNENFLKEALEIAARVCNTEKAYISLFDENNQYIVAQHNSKLKTIPVQDTVCQHTIKSDDILIIDDVKNDERTSCLPSFGEDDFQFYAGVPLISNDKVRIGAVCIFDKDTKVLNDNQKAVLKLLSKQIVKQLDNQRSLIKLIKNINTNFKPSACSDLFCLQSELEHLQNEVVEQNQVITVQKQDLEASNKELSNFANMVAHDVRSPLMTVGNFVYLLENELKKNQNDNTQSYIDNIKKAIGNIDELTVGLLEYAKSDSSKRNHASLDLKAVFETVRLNLADKINTSKAVVVTPSESFKVSGNKVQLIQLFQNLIGNALKYQNGQVVPQVEVKVEEREDHFKIAVIDNGIGIPKKQMSQIFKPFERAHADGKYKGAGIGLATCDKIVENHGSAFVVSSEVNKGSSFGFTLQKGT